MNPSIAHKIIFPSASLRSIIHHYEWLEIGAYSDQQKLTIYPNLASGFLFMFYQGRKMTVSNILYKEVEILETFLIPPTSIPTYNQSFKNVKALRCLFCPGGIYNLYNIPMHAFHNECIELSTEVDKELKFLHEEMAEELDMHRCIALFETYVGKKLNYSSFRKILPATQQILNGKPKGITVQQLAKDLGLGRRHLNRLIQEQVGFSAKQFLQIKRFNQALQHIHQTDKVSLAQTAYQFGYSDQAHFSHEFKAMTNLSPKAYLRSIQKEDFFGLEEDYFYSGTTGYIHTR